MARSVKRLSPSNNPMWRADEQLLLVEVVAAAAAAAAFVIIGLRAGAAATGCADNDGLTKAEQNT